MTKQEITKEILISAFYLGKYLIQKHKLKKKQKLEEAESNKKQPIEKKDENDKTGYTVFQIYLDIKER